MLGQLQNNVPTIAAVMIVKDEEANIKKCLDSIHNYVDQIVIVDTGSTDDTMKIAREYPKVQLFEHPWNDSFSEARNESIRLAEEHTDCDWIFIFDADEMLMNDTGKLIRPVLLEIENKAGSANAIKCNIINYLQDGEARHQAERIFRRGRIKYENRAHNQPRYRGAPSLCPVIIWHWGYALEETAMAAKLARTERLLQMQLDERPYSPCTTMFMIKNYRGQHRYSDVIETSKKFYRYLMEEGLTMTPQIDQIIRTDTIAAYQRSGQLDIATNLAHESAQKYPENLDMIWHVSTLFSMTEQWQQAILAHNQFLYMRDMAERTNHEINIVQNSWGFRGAAYHNISAAYNQLGDLPNALCAAWLATQLDPECETYQELLLAMFEKAVTGDMSPAFEELGIVHDLNNYRGCKCGGIFRKDGNKDRCDNCLSAEAELSLVKLTQAEEGQ